MELGISLKKEHLSKGGWGEEGEEEDEEEEREREKSLSLHYFYFSLTHTHTIFMNINNFLGIFKWKLNLTKKLGYYIKWKKQKIKQLTERRIWSHS